MSKIFLAEQEEKRLVDKALDKAREKGLVGEKTAEEAREKGVVDAIKGKLSGRWEPAERPDRRETHPSSFV